MMILFCVLSLAFALHWRSKYLHTLKSANYNAGLWAQSEQERMETEIENVSLRGQLEMSKKCYERMSEVAREAIKTGETNLDIPAELRMQPDDSILDSDMLE